MYKVFAKEYPVDSYMPALDWDEWYKNILIEGNRDVAEHIPEELENVVKVLRAGDLAEELDALDAGRGWYKNATEAINDYIPVPHKDGKRPAPRLIGRMKKAVQEYAEDKIELAEALTALTGREYIEATIRGYCQGDYARVIYPADEYPNGLKYFEADFFGMFTEYEVHDGENAPDGADDISGYFMRVYDDPAEEIAAEAGCKPDEVKIFRFGGYKKIAVWEEA